ncbi:MAG: sodium-dependent transporter, partial [Propionibacteriaceae bacterium]|nr:sodium-dependent transporter [Propionibacteriaceae bacterium]
LFLPGAVDGLNQLFTPQFDALLDPSVWIAAYAQIFFSLSIAFGIMLTYSSYRRRKANLTAPGLVVGFANSSFELLAGLGVFSALGFMAAQQGVPIDELGGLTGVGLSFITFPTIIAAMPGGQFFGALFFGSLLMAGFTSLVSIFEVVLAGIMDKFNVNRVKGTICIGIPTALISMFCFGVTSGLTTLDIVDKWTNEVGIVLSAVLMIVGVIWILRRDEELALHLSAISTFKVGTIWRILVGNISPLILLFIFIQTVLSLLQEGYGGYPQEYLNTAGWGVFAIMVIGSVIFSVIPWRRNPDDFVVWPTYVKGGLK